MPLRERRRERKWVLSCTAVSLFRCDAAVDVMPSASVDVASTDSIVSSLDLSAQDGLHSDPLQPSLHASHKAFETSPRGDFEEECPDIHDGHALQQFFAPTEDDECPNTPVSSFVQLGDGDEAGGVCETGPGGYANKGNCDVDCLPQIEDIVRNTQNDATLSKYGALILYTSNKCWLSKTPLEMVSVLKDTNFVFRTEFKHSRCFTDKNVRDPQIVYVDQDPANTEWYTYNCAYTPQELVYWVTQIQDDIANGLTHKRRRNQQGPSGR